MGIPDSQAAAGPSSSSPLSPAAAAASATADSPARAAEIRTRAERAAAAAAARAKGQEADIPTSPTSGDAPIEDEEDDDDAAPPFQSAVTGPESARQPAGSAAGLVASNPQIPSAAGISTSSISAIPSTTGAQASSSTLPPVSAGQINALTNSLAGGAAISAKPNASSTPNDLVKGLSDQLTCCECARLRGGQALLTFCCVLQPFVKRLCISLSPVSRM